MAHRLKKGMGVIRPTDEQRAEIFRVAKSLGIPCYGEYARCSEFPDVGYYNERVTICRVEPITDVVLDKEEFIELMKPYDLTALLIENESLRKELESLRLTYVDTRVDFKLYDTHHHNVFGGAAFVGAGFAKKGDEYKVIIADTGYRFELHKDYYNGRTAISLHKVL